LSRARRASKRAWVSLGTVAVLLGIWWALSASGLVPASKLPSPASVWDAFADRWSDGTIPAGIEKSLIRLTVGLVVAVVAGTLIGVAMASKSWVQDALGPLVAGLQALPPIAWLPLAALWLGFTERAVVFVVILGALPAIAMATAASIRQVPPLLIRAGRTLGAKGWDLYAHVVIPTAVPGYVQGLRQGWVFAWRSLLAAELVVVAGKGLGHSLNRVGTGGGVDAPTVMALMAAIAAIGILIDAGFAFVDRRVRDRRGLLVRRTA
jgi:sulfonate transport system permease protein